MWSDQTRTGLTQIAADLRTSADTHELLGLIPADEIARWRDAAELFARAAEDGER